jgi:hypothetical protein
MKRPDSYLAYGRVKRICQEHGAELALRSMLLGAVHKAVERGVFWAPAFFVGDEMFWGNDRLRFVEAALQKGGRSWRFSRGSASRGRACYPLTAWPPVAGRSSSLLLLEISLW